jgi:hypothetical protein
MRRFRGLLLVVLIAPLAGAAKVYQPPEDGVEIRFENFTRERQLFASFWTGVDNCSKPQAIGEVTRSLVTMVTPGRAVTLSLAGRHADIADPDSCAVFFSFLPEAGFSYRATLQTYQGLCRLGFSRVELATNAASSADRVIRTYKMPLLPSQGVCARPDAEQRARLGM